MGYGSVVCNGMNRCVRLLGILGLTGAVAVWASGNAPQEGETEAAARQKDPLSGTPTELVTPTKTTDPIASKQEKAPSLDSNADLLARVEHLEKRLAAVERILFATSQLSVYEADRRLKEAEFQLRERRELFLRGLLAESVWRQDQLQVEILKRELGMAKAASVQKSNVIEIEVLQARQQLSDAKSKLDRSRQLANRGFATLTQIRRDERLVELSQRQLELAEQKLEAARELQGGEEPADSQPAPVDGKGEPPTEKAIEAVPPDRGDGQETAK